MKFTQWNRNKIRLATFKKYDHASDISNLKFINKALNRIYRRIEKIRSIAKSQEFQVLKVSTTEASDNEE